MPSRNLLLASLSEADRSLVQPHLKQIELSQGHVLHDAGGTVEQVCFPFSAVISLVVPLSTGETIEAAMVGRDGVVGAAAALDGKISLSRAIVEIGGAGMACSTDTMKQAAMQSRSIHALLMRHEQVVYAQAQQSAACNATHNVESRLARWMLRARDLAGSEHLPFTQEFIADMLGVRRTSVSVTAHMLQQAGLIRYNRGHIQIMDLEGMRETACECYETVRNHYNLLLGGMPNR
jgi:CRP-like cAMP-binding protein